MKIKNFEKAKEIKEKIDARFYSFGTYTEKDFKQKKIQKF